MEEQRDGKARTGNVRQGIASEKQSVDRNSKGEARRSVDSQRKSSDKNSAAMQSNGKELPRVDSKGIAMRGSMYFRVRGAPKITLTKDGDVISEDSVLTGVDETYRASIQFEYESVVWTNGGVDTAK